MFELVHILSTFSIGLFAGALLTEGCILVPYWRRMDASDFFRLHGNMGFDLFRYFAPLTVLAVTMSILSAGISLASDAPVIWPLVAAGLCVVVLSIFFLYFKKTNDKFAKHIIQDSQLPAELSRWAMWHWFRTVLVMIAFAASITAAI
ncbi:MAG: DUF1772 domain-containing protein [Roseobacter sp.]|uniref:DUF1772 domain-containing protein n=1 Tax=Parasphingorhabdus sp. TaxID=2709688 RepID=UPI0032646A0C